MRTTARQYLDNLRRLRTERESFEVDYSPEERRQVLLARQHGATWEQIADALGRTRSAVWQKYHDIASGPVEPHPGSASEHESTDT